MNKNMAFFLGTIFAILVVLLVIAMVTKQWQVLFILVAAVPIIIVAQTIGILQHSDPKADEKTFDDWYDKK